MEGFTIRDATTKDVSFLVETIIEAEKSATENLSYTTIFGLSEQESKKYITEMLLEEIDGCELSISSFLIAEKNGIIAAAIAAWIEGNEGIPSNVLKGNLLNFILPKECIGKAFLLNSMLGTLSIERVPNTIQLGVVYVASDFRGFNLSNKLILNKINKFNLDNPDIEEMYVQVFSNNISAIRAYEKSGFKIELVKESSEDNIMNYLPSNKKILMKKIITKNN